MSDIWHTFCLFFVGTIILALFGAHGCGFDGKGLRINIDGVQHTIIVSHEDVK